MRAGSSSIHRPAPPVGEVVSRLEPWARPVRHFIALESRRLQFLARGIQLVPLQVGVDVGHAAGRAPPPQESALFKCEAVSGYMVRAEGKTPPERLQPRGQALEGNRVNEVDAHIGDAHLAGEVENARGLGRVGPPLQYRERVRIEALHAEAESVDTTIDPRL